MLYLSATTEGTKPMTRKNELSKTQEMPAVQSAWLAYESAPHYTRDGIDAQARRDARWPVTRRTGRTERPTVEMPVV